MNGIQWSVIVSIGCACGLSGCAGGGSAARDPNVAEAVAPCAPDYGKITRVLDSLHEAAAKADGARYFALYAPDAVFLGTDANERWTMEQFKAYAEPIFAKGRGWTYSLVPGTRHVQVCGDAATFDELLSNAKYGTCRGSGALRRCSTGWKIVQYDLSVPIPNDLLERFAGEIREFELRPR